MGILSLPSSPKSARLEGTSWASCKSRAGQHSPRFPHVLLIAMLQYDQVSPAISSIEERLRREFQAQSKKAKDFVGLKTPTERANSDLEFFLKHYFGNKTTTTEPLRLPGLHDRQSMHQAAEKIPGLYTMSGGEGCDSRVLVIGWDYAAVLNEIQMISKEQRAERRKEADDEWAGNMKKHIALVKEYKLAGKKKALSLPLAKGSYVLIGKKDVRVFRL